MRMNYRAFLLFFSVIVVLLSLLACRDSDPDARTIYCDYYIWGDEETGIMTTRLQYRYFGPGGKTVRLHDPASVAFDGSILQADSARMNGVYYEVMKPVTGFTGKHTITFTTPGQNQYKEEFDFTPFRLKTEVPAVFHRGDLVLELDGVEKEDYIQVILSDTALFSEGLECTDTIIGGRLTITREELMNVASGPVYLELLKTTERELAEKDRRRGRLIISYGLRRTFELAD